MKDEKYLNELIDEYTRLKAEYVYSDLMKEDEYFVSYMATKKTSFLGYKHGYYELFIQQKNGIEETDKIRKNCKNYLKLFKNYKGDLVQVQNIKNGKIDCVHQVHRINDTIYLFPFSSDGGFYPTYGYVTKYSDNHVTEEYMVHGNQIIYERYEEVNGDEEYYFINYVRNGKYPVLEERKGVFTFDPLGYKELESDYWMN